MILRRLWVVLALSCAVIPATASSNTLSLDMAGLPPLCDAGSTRHSTASRDWVSYCGAGARPLLHVSHYRTSQIFDRTTVAQELTQYFEGDLVPGSVSGTDAQATFRYREAEADIPCEAAWRISTAGRSAEFAFVCDGAVRAAERPSIEAVLKAVRPVWSDEP